MVDRRWLVLAAGTVVQTSQAAAYAGLAVLAPVLRDRYHLSLSQIGVLLGVSSIGAVLTLLPWGLAADRVGERITATIGLLGAAAGLAAAAYAPEFASLVLFLFAAGAFGASSNTATGRAVTSWFRREERGFALAIRQTAVPIGGFMAALGVPAIADHWSSRAALLALAAFSLVAALTAAAFLVEGPVGSGPRGPGRRAPAPAARPAHLAALRRELAADLHAGRGHRLHRPLPRVAPRLLATPRRVPRWR